MKFKAKLKLKWKLVLWSTLLMMGLFVSYNLLQYFVMNSWMVRYEEQSIERKMDTTQEYYSKQDNQKLSIRMIKESKSFLESINEKSETIRILDQYGRSIVAVSEEELLNAPKRSVQKEQFELQKMGDDRLLVFRKPLVETNFVGTIEIVRNLEIFDGLLEQFGIVMLLTGIGAFFLSLLGAIFLSKQFLKPIQDISYTLTRIKKYGLEERVLVHQSQDEIAQLAIHFNELMDELEESFNRQKQFVGDASHELRTPLSVLQGNLMMLKRWGKNDPDVLNKSLTSSLREVERMNQLVKDLLELSRLDSEITNGPDIQMIEPKQVIEKVVNDFRMTHPDFEFHLFLADQATIAMTESHLEQVMTILVDNSIKYSDLERKLVIQYHSKSFSNEIIVQDFGVGIPEEEIPFVTNRFYRVEKSRNRKTGGYGIGLSIAQKIMDTYGGSMRIESELGKGTSVTLTFPNPSNRDKL
jgi:two-component system sensor histidine kinase ArlS